MVSHLYYPPAGHTDFPARDEFEFRLLQHVKQTQKLGRVSIERFCSGMGLTNIFDFICSLRKDGNGPHPDVVAAISSGRDKNSIISEYALNGKCNVCTEALERFINIYGAEAGNLALKTLPTGGIYIAGGIAAKVMWAVTKDNRFVKAFLDKGRMRVLLEKIPIYVVFEPAIGLLGSRVMCRRMLRQQLATPKAKSGNMEHLRIHARL
jgi:glucokinase